MTQNRNQRALQLPLGSGFHAASTAAEVISGIDLTGKTAIVTGGNTGIGLETVKILAGAGANVIAVGRDLGKAKENLKGVERVEIAEIDFMKPGSIDLFADAFLSSGRALHILINNAGTMWVPLRRDERGIESQLATNYLGQFHLTARLWPALKMAKVARVVNVSSCGHQLSDFDFEDPNFLHREYDTLKAYGQSKTASNLFAVALDKYGEKYGVSAYSLHPGAIHGTELGREAPLELFQKMGFVDQDGQMYQEVIGALKTIAQGAATTVWCASSPMLDKIGGVYCEDADVATLISGGAVEDVSQMRAGVKSYALDEESASRLWDWSEKITGVTFQ